MILCCIFIVRHLSYDTYTHLVSQTAVIECCFLREIYIFLGIKDSSNNKKKKRNWKWESFENVVKAKVDTIHSDEWKMYHFNIKMIMDTRVKL